MRLTVLENGGNLEGSISISSLTLTGQLLLSNIINEPLHAVHKQYVDSLFLNLDASNLTTGQLTVDRLPGYTGDVTIGQGSNISTLANGVLPAGSFVKVTVNNKGLVTGSTGLVESDIPDLDWGSITIGKPTTVTGYGITNAANTQSPITGNLTLSGSPVDPTDLVSKQYADTVVLGASGDGLATGDIIGYPLVSTPTGYIRANGAILDKTTYADLYAIIGDSFSIQNAPGSGKPWSLQYDINLTQDGVLTNWVAGVNLPSAVTDSRVIVTKNRVYLLGGFVGGSASSTVHTAPINTNGTLGTWTTAASLPAVSYQHGVVVTKNRVYVLSGTSSYTAPINTDGTLGTWTTVTTALPTVIRTFTEIVTKNRVYILGGLFNNTVSTVIYTAPINSDGTLGAWVTDGNVPINTTLGQLAVTKNMVHLLGSSNNSDTYSAPINPDGTLGTWTLGTSLPGTLDLSSVLVTRKRVYLLGGRFSGNTTGTTAIFSAPINEDGTLGTWSSDGSLLGVSRFSAQVIVTGSNIYLLGGLVGGTQSNAVRVAPIQGGSNDYSPYYDGSIILVDPNSFAIPDFSNSETSSLFYYIKL